MDKLDKEKRWRIYEHSAPTREVGEGSVIVRLVTAVRRMVLGGGRREVGRGMARPHAPPSPGWYIILSNLSYGQF